MKKILVIMIMVLSAVVVKAEGSPYDCFIIEGVEESSSKYDIQYLQKCISKFRKEVAQLETELNNLDPNSSEYHETKVLLIQREYWLKLREESLRYKKTKEIWTIHIDGKEYDKTVEVAPNTTVDEYVNTEENVKDLISYVYNWQLALNKVDILWLNYDDPVKMEYERDNYTLFITKNPVCNVTIISPRGSKEITIYKKYKRDLKPESKLQQNPEKAKKLDGSWN